MASRESMTSEDAVAQAAKYLTAKVDKQHRKHSKEENDNTTRQKYTKLPNTDCNCEMQKMDIKEGNGECLTLFFRFRYTLYQNQTGMFISIISSCGDD